MNDILMAIVGLSVLVFVVSSMLAMGLSLTVKQILDPLKDTRTVLLALLANFLLVPLLAYIIIQFIPLETGLATGLIIVACAAGAPFLPKLVENAKGNMAFSVGLMTLLMVVTVVYLPLVLPYLLSGASVNPWDIAKSLIIMMLTPLGTGLFIKSRYETIAKSLQPHMSHASSVALMIMLGGTILTQLSTIITTIGTGAIVAGVIFILGALVIGYFLGGDKYGTKSVMGLGTSQRNLSAAILVAGQNFSDDPNVLVMILVMSIIGLIMLMIIGGEMGKRTLAKK